MLVLIGVGFGGQSAHAQDDGLAIRAQVIEQQRNEAGQTDNQPVVGVTITIVDADGNEVGSAATDDDGIALIPIPERADYQVLLDESTLPDGQAIAPRSSPEQSVLGESFRTNTRIVNFFTGENQSVGQSNLDRYSQRIADGIRLGMIISMAAVGLSLIFGTTGLTNFAHGEMVTFGGMMAFLFNVRGVAFLGFLAFLPGVDSDGRFQIFLATPIAVVFGGLLGYALDRWGFALLRRKGIGLISQMIVTIGLGIIMKNLFLFFFGGRRRPYADYASQVGVDIGPVTITQRDLTITILSAIVLVAVALSLQYSRLGKATRAVSDNIDLASATGIDTARVIRIIWISGGALAALGGVFRGLDEQVGWDMGTQLLFLMFAAITVGGLGSAYGALVGGLLVGLFVETSTLFGVPTELKTVPALFAMIVVLLVRPQGILGRSQRVG